MSRSIWKGVFVNSAFFKRPFEKKKLVWSKSSTILGNSKGNIIFVYNGKEFKKLFVTSAKLGFKFGQFIFTRKYNQKNNLKIKKK